MTVAFVVQKVLSFVYFVYYANRIGAGDTGKFIFAVSFVTIFGILVDLGFSPVLIREISRDHTRAQSLLSNILKIKSICALLTALGIGIVVHYLGYPLITQQLIWLATIVMVAESFSLTLYGVLRGFHNLQYEAIGSILYQLLTMAVGFIALQVSHNPLVLAFAIVGGSLANFLFALFNVKRKLGLAFRARLEEAVARNLLKTATPFFIAGIFTKVYAYIDIVLLSLMKGDLYVGWYSIAYKLTYSLQFLPIAFSNAIYPVFSRLFVTNRDQLARALERGLQYVLLISLPVSIGAAVLAESLVQTLWPTFENAIPALRIGVIGLIFVFANFILSSFLNACNQQRTNTINIGLTMGVNVILNIILIPIYAHIGAAIAAATSALFLLVINVIRVRQQVKINNRWLTGVALKTTGAAGIMGFVAREAPLPLFMVIGLSVIVYVIAIFVTRAITLTDIRTVWVSLIHKQPNAPTPSANS